MKRIGIAAAAALFAMPVWAAPPPLGAIGRFPAPVLLCDTQEQVVSLFHAFELGINTAITRYTELNVLKNARGERTCDYTTLQQAMMGKRKLLGDFTPAQKPMTAWAVHVLNPSGEGWILFFEVSRTAQDITQRGWI